MRLQRTIFISLLLLLLACSRDSEDILALQTLLKNPVHVQLYASLKNSFNFQQSGFDNVISLNQLTPLRRNTRVYLKFLDKFEPGYVSTQKMHENLKQPLLDFDNKLGEMASRLEAYRTLTQQIDSLSAAGNQARLTQLDQKEQLLHRQLTNQFLIDQTAELLNEINRQLEIIYRK